jgi:4a-hydroxytetrahydrobiopterin dehydratase
MMYPGKAQNQRLPYRGARRRAGTAMGREKLNEQQVAEAVAKLPGWSIRNGVLHREFVFKDFVEAFGFMTRVALAAEAMNHHPDWSNSWNRVSISLITHSAGGLTANDFDLAAKIQAL